MASEGAGSGFYMDENYYAYYKPGMKMTDGLPESVMEVVDPHWSQFPPVNPMIPHFFGVMLFFLYVISFTGNLLVMYIFLKTPSLRTATNVFVVNLAFSDLCMMTTQALPTIINIFMHRFWMWGTFNCSLYGYLGALFGTVSIMSMVVIGYDRYNVIVKGFNGVKITPVKAVLAMAGVWLYSAGTGLPALLGVWGRYASEGLLYTCSYDYLSEDPLDRSYIWFTIIFNYIFPMTMVIFFYSSIVKAVWAHEFALKQQAKKMNVDSLRSNTDNTAESAEMRIAKVAVTNVCLWAGIWSPYAFVVFMPLIGMKASVTPLVSQLPSFFAKTASVFNPLVYAVSHPKYREALMKEVPCLGINEASSSGDSGTVKENA